MSIDLSALDPVGLLVAGGVVVTVELLVRGRCTEGRRRAVGPSLLTAGLLAGAALVAAPARRAPEDGT